MIMKRMLALLFALSLVAAACSDSADSEGSGSDTTAAAASGGDDGDGGDGDGGEMPSEILTDFGVTDDVIRIGMSPDLSGRFAGLTTPLTEAQKVFWEKVNDEGGIAGRQIELEIIDNAYDVTTNIENYATLAQENDEGVVMISQSTGSPHTSAIAKDAAADNMVVLPLSWYSGWADPDFGGLILEAYANYCIEGMNGVAFLAQQVEASGESPKLAVLSYPGEYGQDGAAGAKLAADALGIEVVFDGEAQVAPGQDQTSIVAGLVGSGANMVWITTGPADLGAIFGGAAAQGFTGLWSGNSPTYSPALLGGDLAPALSAYYFHSTYSSLWDSNDSPGMKDMVATMTERRPDDLIQDVYVWGWTEGMITKAVLEQAAANGDMTRAGVAKAALEVQVDFQGLAPDQNWTGDPNDFIVRETYIYDVDVAGFNQVSLADYAATGEGGTGFSAMEGFAPFVSEPAANYTFTEPCFVSAES